jgi:PAS domain S-box-containing protein
VWEWNIKTGEFYLDPNLKALLGYSDDEIPNDLEQWVNHIHPDDRQTVMAAVQAHLEGKTPDYTYEHRILHRDGSIIWIMVRGMLHRDDQGNPERMVGTDTDITDRKQAEIALRESEERNRAILLAIPDIMAVVNASGYYLSYSYNKLAGETTPLNAEPIGLHVTDVLPPEWASQWLVVIQQVLSTGEIQTFEQQLQIGDRICHEEVRIVPYKRDAVLTMVRNISDRKQAELALRDSEERYRLLSEVSPVGIFQNNASGEAIYVNERWCQMTGLTPEQGMGDGWVQSVHPDDRDRIFSEWNQTVGQGVPLQIEGRYLRPDGSILWVSSQIVPELDAVGDVTGYIGTSTDITRLKQAEADLQQLNQELEQRVQQRTQELIQSEQDLRTIFNNVYDAIFIHDLDGTILDFNDRALELHAATREQLRTAMIADLSAPDAPLERLPEIFQRVQAGETVQFEWRDRRFRDNSIFDAEVSLQR